MPYPDCFRPAKGIQSVRNTEWSLIIIVRHRGALRRAWLDRPRVRRWMPEMHGAGQLHRGKSIVEEDDVRHMGAIVARERDLVHAVVEAENAVVGHYASHIRNNALW